MRSRVFFFFENVDCFESMPPSSRPLFFFCPRSKEPVFSVRGRSQYGGSRPRKRGAQNKKTTRAAGQAEERKDGKEPSSKRSESRDKRTNRLPLQTTLKSSSATLLNWPSTTACALKAGAGAPILGAIALGRRGVRERREERGESNERSATSDSLKTKTDRKSFSL